jgi:Uma2 family endonuclease
MTSVMTQIRGTDSYSFHDYLQTVNEQYKAHLFGGLIVMESPAAARHEELQNFLAILVGTFVSERQLGRVFGSRMTFKLSGHDGVEPDLSFVSSEHLDRIKKVHVDGPPDLAVEIVSPGTRKLDYEAKRPAYERAGTPELWIVDYLKQRADFFCLENRHFVTAELDKGRYFASRALRGFRLDVRWLWSDPLPRPQPILTKLLRR